MRRSIPAAAAAVLLLALGACTENDGVNAATGAALGAAVGNQFGDGRGRTAATVAGGVAGAYVGATSNERRANGGAI